MIALDLARGSRRTAVSGARVLPLFLLLTCSCSEDAVAPHITPPPSPAGGTTISWSFDAQAEGVVGAGTTPAGTLALSGRSLYQLGSDGWKPIAPGISAHDISTSTEGELFALVGARVSRLVDNQWVQFAELTGGEYFEVQAVWAYDAGHVFVTTDDYDETYGFDFISLLESTSTGWKGFDLPYVAADIWGVSPDDVWVVGQHGMVVHFDGTRTTAIQGVTGNNLRGIWGVSSDDVYAVGEQGKVVHYDGVGWSGLSRPTTLPLSIARVIGGKLVVAGAQGACFRYDGGVWEDLSAPVPNAITGLIDDENGGMFATATCGIMHFTNGTWRYVFGSSGSNLRAVWCAPDGGVTVVGDEGVIEQRDQNGWRPAFAGTSVDQWYDVAGTSSSDIYAVGYNGKLAHYDGTSWTLHPSGTGAHLSAVWASPERVVIAYKGSIREWSNDGSVPMPGVIPAKDITDLWGASADDIYAVGESGMLLHYDGQQWSKIETNVSTRWFTSVWGSSATDVFAVGWSSPYDGPTRYWGATILHYDGDTWQRMPSEGVGGLDAVWGYDGRHVLGIATLEVGYFDGSAWTNHGLDNANQQGVYMRDVSGVPGGDIFATSGNGVIRLTVTGGGAR